MIFFVSIFLRFVFEKKVSVVLSDGMKVEELDTKARHAAQIEGKQQVRVRGFGEEVMEEGDDVEVVVVEDKEQQGMKRKMEEEEEEGEKEEGGEKRF